MKKRCWRRRVLTMFLAIALVLGNINATTLVSQAATNAYEATSTTHGATYDATAKQVTFWVKSSDPFYSQIGHMWYKEYTSYEEAANAHVSAGGNFISGVGATNLVENGEATEKSVAVNVQDSTKAILYYINGEAGHARPDYEHIIVISDASTDSGNEGEGSGEGSSETPSVPAAPFGIVAGYNTGKINVVWGAPQDTSNIIDWTISIDGTEVKTVTSVAAYDIDNVYAEGEHTVSIVARSEAGPSEAGTATFTLTAEQAGTTGGSGEGGSVEEDENVNTDAIVFDDVTTTFYRSQDDGGWAGDSNAAISYDGTKAVVSADSFGWNAWGLQWKLVGLTSEAEENVYAFDVVSSINKSINVKNETAGVMETITLTAGETYHYETAVAGTTVDITFDLVGGEGAGTLTFTNMTFKEGTITEEGGDEEEDETVVSDAIVFDDVNTTFYRSQDDGGWAGDSNAAISYDGTKAVVSADSFGWNAWGLQWKLVGLISEAEENVYAFDVVSSINKSINVKNETSGVMETITLTAGETYHYETAVTGTTVDITFDLVGGEGAGTLTFTNMTFKEGTITEEGGDEEEDETVVSDAIVFDDVNTTFYRSQDDGGWAGDSNAAISYDETKAVVSADSFGWNAWGLQWKLVGLTSEAEENVYAFDVVSSINKSINVKNETSGVMETITLVAGETYHYETAVTGKTVDITFDLVGGEGAGTLTFTNMVFGAESEAEEEDNRLVFDDLDTTFYRSQDDGGWAGDSNATISYDGTKAVVSADSFGWNAWGLQWKLVGLTSEAEENVYAFDVVSSINKSINVKNETSGVMETITLTAGETYHYETAVTGKNVDITFDLVGGEGAGTLTFTNMTFGPAEGGSEEEEDKPEDVLATITLTSAKGASKTEGYKVGDSVVLNFDAADSVWAEKVTAVKVNNQTIDKANYTFASGTLTLSSSVFTKQNVYAIEVEADGYSNAQITLPVYDAQLSSENWQVAWEDQFNGTELDSTKWSYEIGVRSGDDATSDAAIYWGNDEKQYYTKEAVAVKDGYLVITGNELTDAVKQQYGITDTFVKYSSGRIRTITDDNEVLASAKYGRIEAKMALPAEEGYWPAFWMLPTDNVYGVWASSGELDIMEARGHMPGQVNGTIHYGGTWPNNVSTEGTYTFPEGQSIAGEHLYAVEWEPGEIRWYVDDVLYRVENNWYGIDANGEKYSYPAPFDEDFYVLFNLAMSGSYISNIDPVTFGQQMKVDYVRILVDENADYDKEVTTPSSDRDTEFFETVGGGYVDLIQDKDYTTLADHAYGDGATVVPGIGYWSSAVNTGAGAAATVAVVDGVAKIDVTKMGTNDYNIQLIQNIPLAKGYTYRITFDAWTDLASGRGIAVAPKGDEDNKWATYDGGINAVLGTTKKTFTHDFVMAADSDPTARLEMNLGGAVGSVYVDNVSVIALTDEQINESGSTGAKEPLTDGEHIYNGTFDKGTGRLGYWTVEGTKGSTENRDYTVTVGTEGANLTQTGIQLLEQDEYQLTFDAKTAGKGAVRVTLTDDKNTTVYVTKEYTLDKDAVTYELNLTVPTGKGTDLGTLTFEFIGEGETVTIDNVSMKRLTNVHMEWDAYEFYPIGTEGLSDFTLYDEAWSWSTNPVNPTDIGNGEMALVVDTVPCNQNWQVLLQRVGAQIAKGQTYRIKYAIKASVEGQPVQVKIEDTNYSPCYDQNLTVGTEWQYVDTTFVSTLAGAGDLKFCLGGVDQNCTIYVKDVEMVMEGVPVPQFVAGSEIEKMTVGDSQKLNIEHSVKVQEKYDSFTYESSASDVIAVAADGTLTAKAAGEATITVTSALGTEFSFDVKVVAASAGGEDSDEDTGNDDETGDETDKDEEADDEEVSKELLEEVIEIVVGEDSPKVKIEKLAELFEAVFSTEEQEQIKNGADISVKVEVEREEPGKREQELVKGALGKKKLGTYFDIDIIKMVGNHKIAVTELSESIRMTLDIPEDLRATNRKFAMIRIHDGIATELADLDKDANTITFESDCFSTYALVYEETSSGGNNGGSNTGSSNAGSGSTSNNNASTGEANSSTLAPGSTSPKTGEVTTYLWIVAVLAVGVVAIEIAKKYYFRKEN